MDRRIRDLERAALSGDPYAIEMLNLAKCRAFGHDWETKQKCISTFPIEYKTINVKCKRCSIDGDEVQKPTAPEPKASAMERMLSRYAYGTVEELHREYQKIVNESNEV